MVIETVSFARLLRRYRRAAELTQEGLAERAGISARAIRAMEGGEPHRPRPDTLELLMEALSIPEAEHDDFLAAADRLGPVTPTPSSSLPATRLVTILLADIRGYTRFTQEQGDEAGAGLAERFAEITGAVVEQGGGTVLELRGDEALCLFESARAALRTALALQERFGQGEQRLDVGIGLDVGEAVSVKGGYRGRALNLAARLCSIATAGEVFASNTVTTLAGKMGEVDYIDRGEVSLKGLTEPTRVIQIAPPGTVPNSLPPLQEILRTHPGNLPDSPTAFIGRGKEIAVVRAMLQRPDIRLITLTGPGGVGKTRLSLQIGASVLYDFKDGVFVVSLASVGDPQLVASTIAGTVGIKEVGGRALPETLTSYFRHKHLLLLLDNFEHLLEASDLVADLLDACRRIKIIVTSRAVLSLSREHAFEVSPFSVPSPEHLPDLASLSRNESVALFTQQAQAVRADFALTAESAETVVAICRRLDGLPLAIELAAVHTRLFSPQALLGRLSSRLELLTGGPRDAPDRHRTLRSALDWSYDLLEPADQRLFARLGVFSGGCTLQAAEILCAVSPDAPFEVLDGVTSLVKHSLVRRDEGSEGEPRFVMLDTIRDYAAECLERSGEANDVRQRHVDYYLNLAEQAAPKLHGTQLALWMERLEKDQDNLRSALRWAISRKDCGRALRLVVALSTFWTWRCQWSEARKWLQEVLAVDDPAIDDPVPSELRVKALRLAGGMARAQGDYTQAAPLLNESLARAQRRGDRVAVAEALNQLGILAAHIGNHAEATNLIERSILLARETSDKSCIATYLDNLGLVLMYQEDYERATGLMEESLALYRELGYEAEVAEVLGDLSWLALHDGNFTHAQNLLKESLGLSRQSRNTWLAIRGLEGLARTATCLGQEKRAARLWGAVDTLSVDVDISFPAAELALHQRYLTAARTQFDPDTFARGWEEGSTMTLEQVVDYALRDDAD